MEKARILIIDDEQSILDTLSLIFETEPDFEVLALSDVLKWREAIERFQPEMILVDYRMPAMNGDVLIQAINASGMRGRIRAIGLFSATPFTHAEVQRLGADFFFEKPFNIDHLLSSLRESVRPRRAG
ncbi:MAG: response regulator [Bdellovibrionota bacterium]